MQEGHYVCSTHFIIFSRKTWKFLGQFFLKYTLTHIKLHEIQQYKLVSYLDTRAFCKNPYTNRVDIRCRKTIILYIRRYA